MAGQELHLQRFDDRASDLVLHGEDAGQLALVGLRPQVVPARHVDDLCRDADAVPLLAYASFQHGSDVELASDVGELHALALEEEGRGASRHVQPLDVGEGVQDFLRDAVREVLLILLRAQVGERKHRDRRRPRLADPLRSPSAVPEEVVGEPGRSEEQPEPGEHEREASPHGTVSRAPLRIGGRRGRCDRARCGDPGEHGHDGEADAQTRTTKVRVHSGRCSACITGS